MRPLRWLLPLALLLLAHPAYPMCPSFKAMISVDTGKSPNALTIGDLNGDGLLDLVTAATGNQSVSVNLGHGDGTFGAHAEYFVAGSASSVAIGDLNGDGKPDVVAVDSDQPLLEVLLGDGNGTLASRVEYVLGSPSRFVAIADVNGDGKKDVVLTTNAGFSIYFNSGSGALTTHTDYSDSSLLFWIDFADLDGDGHLDMVVADAKINNPDPLGGGGTSVVAVRHGNGDGSFGSRIDYSSVIRPVSIAAKDFDGDGLLDLVAAGNYGISFFKGNGDGTFAPEVRSSPTQPASDSRLGMAVGDLNGDGALDLVTVTDLYNTATVRLGNGDGTFTNFATLGTGGSSARVGLTDVNRDGKLDLLYAGKGASNVSVLFGHANGTFTTGTSVPAMNSAVIGDVNGDGHPDIRYTNGGLYVLLGQGGDQFVPAFAYNNVSAFWLAAGDVNGDGWPDAVTSYFQGNPGTDSIAVFLGAPSGALIGPTKFQTVDDAQHMEVVDVNGDGKADVVVAGNNNRMWLHLGNGDGTFGPASQIGDRLAMGSFSVTDMNGDSKPDIVAITDSMRVAVLFGQGDGTFPASLKIKSDSFSLPTAITAGDATGDGKKDIVVTTNGSTKVSVFPGHGDGTFSPRVDLITSREPYTPVIGEFTGDGVPDVAVACTGGICLLVGGGGTFTRKDYLVGGGGTGVWAADLNGDGLSDLLSRESAGTSVYLDLGCAAAGITEHDAPRGPLVVDLYPNPFRNESTLRFTLPDARHVVAELYDLGGRRVRTLVPGAQFAAGAHTLQWDRRGGSGRALPDGVYFVRIRAGDEETTRHVVLMK